MPTSESYEIQVEQFPGQWFDFGHDIFLPGAKVTAIGLARQFPDLGVRIVDRNKSVVDMVQMRSR